MSFKTPVKIHKMTGKLRICILTGVMLSCSGSSPPASIWVDTAVSTSEGIQLVRSYQTLTQQQIETVQRRVFEGWRDCRKFNPPTNLLCEDFRPEHVLAWNYPLRGDKFGGYLHLNGKRYYVAYVGGYGWLSSYQHETVLGHAICHYARNHNREEVPDYVSCEFVGHIGHYRLDGTRIPVNTP